MSKPKIAVRLDWLQGTFQMSRWDEVWIVLHRFFGAFYDADNSFYGYVEQKRTLSGVYVLFSSNGKRDRDEFCVGIPGACLSEWDDGGCELFCALSAAGLRPTRIDVAADDFSKVVTPEQVYDVVEAGDVQGHKPHIELVKSDSKRGKGMTCYIGKRGKLGSGRQIAIYDKNVESGGKVDSIRWEVRFFKEMARAAGLVLGSASGPVDFLAKLGGLVGSSVHFPMRMGGAVRVDRAEQHPFWRRLLTSLGRCCVKVERVRSSWERFVREAPKRIRISLAVFREALGEDRFADLVQDMLWGGEVRMSGYHKALAAAGAAAPSCDFEDLPF